MTSLSVQDIADLRLLGYHVTNKEGQTFVDGNGYVFEEDFGRWYLYSDIMDCFVYIDEFETIWEAIAYVKEVLS